MRLLLLFSLLSGAFLHAATYNFTVDLVPGEIVPVSASDDPSGSDALGTASFTLNTDDAANPTLSYTITLTNLYFSDTPRILTDAPPGDSRRYVRAVHLHFGARGTNGMNHALNIYGRPAEHDAQMALALTPGVSVSQSLSGIWDNSDANDNGTPMAMDDTVTLSSALDDLENGNLYLQIHTLDFRQGELRGQLTAVPEPTTLLGLLLAGLGFLTRRGR